MPIHGGPYQYNLSMLNLKQAPFPFSDYTQHQPVISVSSNCSIDHNANLLC
jgi:hypothetical protein